MELPVDELAERVATLSPRAGATTVVAIDGPAGSGKTTLAGQLAPRVTAAVLHMDHVYPGWDGLEQAADTLVRDVLVPLATGRQAQYRRWDWHRDEYAGWTEVPAVPLLIVEGCGSGSTAAAPYLSLLVWVEAPHDLRMARGIDRDGEAFRPHWERWARQEDTLFAAERTRERADVLISTADDRPRR